MRLSSSNVSSGTQAGPHDKPRIQLGDVQQATLFLNLVIVVIILIATAWVNVHSILGYISHLCTWLLFILAFDRKQFILFLTAFNLNALFTIIFVVVQLYYFLEGYGTTSPFSLSQTDDSYFFSLIADHIPIGLETRPHYDLYSSGFTDLIRFVSRFTVSQPLDVLYFQSGIAALLAVYAKEVAAKLANAPRALNIAYWLSLCSPLLMMNGGVILLRDTFVAAVFILSVHCVISKRLWAFVLCCCFQFYLRPGTAMILLCVLGVLYSREISHAISRLRFPRAFVYMAVLTGMMAGVLFVFRGTIIHKLTVETDLLEQVDFELAKFTSTGRVNEGDALGVEAGGSGTFAWIVKQPLPLRLLFSPAYVVLSPFFNPTGAIVNNRIDLRLIGINVLGPLFAFFVHAWVITGLIGAGGSVSSNRRLFIAYLFGCLLIGVYSMQSRHKVILEPLYYVLAAAGFKQSVGHVRWIGFVVSGLWLGIQLLYYLLLVYH